MKGRSFTGEKGEHLDPYDALIYKYIGQGYKLNNHTANPKTNEYIRNLNTFANEFSYKEKNTYYEPL